MHKTDKNINLYEFYSKVSVMENRELTVLYGILDDKLVKSFICGNKSEFLRELYISRAEENLTEYIQKVILTDDNAFARACANNIQPSRYLEKAYKADLNYIFSLIGSAQTEGNYDKGAFTPPFYPADTESTVRELKEFYSKHGYGKFIFNRAFTVDGEKLTAVADPVKTTLDSLKDYQTEKKIIESNLVCFLRNLPCQHILLYGDKGTGKSSTIHALLNKYADDGLRLVQVTKSQLTKLNAVRDILSQIPLKFLIFIDDLSLNPDDGELSAIKSALEGYVGGGSENTLIVATSNRRHVVKEVLADRENDVHAGDGMQEQLSLADRFGLTVYFSSTDKDGYLSIVRQIAEDYRLDLPDSYICGVAEKFALAKGGRSPRRARQIVELMYSASVTGEEVNF